MHTIEQFARDLADITRVRRAGDHEEAFTQIQRVARLYLKGEILPLLSHHPDQILDHFRDESNELDGARCAICADLAYELAHIFEANQLPVQALPVKALCLHLYTMAIPAEKALQVPRYRDRVEALRRELAQRQLPDALTSALKAYDGFVYC